MQQYTISATGHSLNYLPEYIAQRHGFFEQQGLCVTASVPSPWDLVLTELATGTADAALGGVWVPSMFHGRCKSYTAFAQVSNRCPLALLKRGSASGFKLSDTIGRTVLVKSGNGASVGLFFKMMLRESGIDPSSLDYVQDLDGKMLASLFEGGMGDYFVVDIITARLMAQNNPKLSVCMEMVTDGGEIPWSVYYCETGAVTAAAVRTQTRFCAALLQGIRWILAHDAETFKDELTTLFPTIPVDILVDVTNQYRHNGMWTTPVVNRKGFERWQKGISDGRLIEAPLAYNTIVDKTAAAAAVAAVTTIDADEASTAEGGEAFLKTQTKLGSVAA